MKVYGLRIGTAGLEFGNRDEREKAMVTFTRSSVVEICGYEGPRYKEDQGKTFSTYERETEQNTQNCGKCNGQFSGETCGIRTVPKRDWQGKWQEGTEEKTLCDGCYTKWLEDKRLADARAVVDASKIG